MSHKIVIRWPNWVGDAVMAMPALKIVRENFPQSHLSILCSTYVKEVVNGAPWYDDILEITPSKSKFTNFMAQVQALRQGGFDFGLLLTNSFVTALTFYLAGIKKRGGYARDGRGFLLTEAVVPPSEPLYTGEWYRRLLFNFGIQGTWEKPTLFSTARDKTYFDQLSFASEISRNQNIIGIAPGAQFGSSKLWPVNYWVDLIHRLVEALGAKIVLLCPPSELALQQKIIENLKVPIFHFGIAPEKSLTLGLLKEVIPRLRFLITTDSGIRHFAISYNIPTLVLMGPTDHRLTASVYEQGKVLREPVECSPCQLRVCPIDHRCMVRLVPEKVFEVAKTLC